jgi:NAD(P)-dependent dehydrogenase (short-subunit alcohol dehydrogenase family)
MNRFEGKTVLLTGAASGMGRATAIRLVGEGAAVFAVDRNEAGLKETATLVPDGPGRLVTRVADVADEQDVVDAVAAAVAELGGLDVLANVAGIHRTTPLATLTAEEMLQLFSVNALGTVLFCREAAPHLAERKGVIVNIASTAATKGHPYMTAYAASKGAVLALSQTLAAELAPRGIRVVAISPGGVRTPLTEAAAHWPEGTDPSYFARVTPLLGFGEADDIAAAIAFAASSDGRYWSGSELRIDGGSHI